MIESTDRQRGLVGWSISILFHAGLLIFGAALLIEPARFHVEAGQTTTEIEFAVQPAPTPFIAQPATPPPTPVQPPPVQAAPVPEPVKQVVLPSEPAITPPPRSPVVAKPRLARTPIPHKATPAKETSSASKGAIQAHPDDVHNEPPEYPEDSRAAREQGVVILRVEVTAAGEPASVSILNTCGYFRLDQAARRAVLHWKFHPGIAAGIRVSSEADVPVRFKLQ